MHRAKVLAEPFMATGPHGFNVGQLQFLVRGMPKDDENFLAEDRRFGGRTGNAEARGLAPLSPTGGPKSVTLAN